MPTATDKFASIVNPIVAHIVNPVIGLMFLIALVVFAFGIFEMIWKGADSDAVTKGKAHMLGGVIGMFIMVSAWGIIHLISNTVKSI